uniref:Uncharacterized protein n=1 Tax=Ditylenchus dipsaci TaxID=166011 RepID=A0A915DLM1_9BILA
MEVPEHIYLSEVYQKKKQVRIPEKQQAMSVPEKITAFHPISPPPNQAGDAQPKSSQEGSHEKPYQASEQNNIPCWCFFWLMHSIYMPSSVQRLRATFP